MSSIDERIVAMKFDGSKFQSGIEAAKSAFDKLKSALDFKGGTKGLDDINAAAKRTDLSTIGRAVEDIKSKFSALGVIGVTAIAKIASSAMNFAGTMARNFVRPIVDGFGEYETKMGSIQTILANTQRHGTDLATVNSELDNLNKYADKTIYNFAEMTRNASLFTNAGIKIEDATLMIKGFSNAAAASGTSAGAAAGAAYQLTQAMNTGVVRLMDWKSLTNAGMGNKNMQDGLIGVADAMGQFNSETTTATAAGQNFNSSLESQWLSADVMTEYLKIMSNETYELAYAQAKSIGLGHEQADALARQAETAFESATKVRTFTQLIGTYAEGVASGWTETIELVIGDFEQATELFTGISETLEAMTTRSAESRNALVGAWVSYGGRDAVIEGLANSWQILLNLTKPIKEAFNDIFGGGEAGWSKLVRLSKAFRDFTERIKMGTSSLGGLKAIFTGFFAILKTAMTILSAVVRYFFDFAKILGGALLGGLVAIAGSIGHLISKFLEWVNTNDRLQNLLNTIIQFRNDALEPLAKAVNTVMEAFAKLIRGDVDGFFDGLKDAAKILDPVFQGLGGVVESFLGVLSSGAKGISDFFKSLGIKALEPFQKALDTLSQGFDDLKERLSFKLDFGSEFQKLGKDSKALDKAAGAGERFRSVWESVKGVFSNVIEFLTPIVQKLGSFLGTMIDKFRVYLEGLSGSDILALVNTGFFIAAYRAITTFTNTIKDAFEGWGEAGADLLEQATKSLKTMQRSIKANILIKIAVAIGILALSLKVLSSIEQEDILPALAAMAAMFVQLGITMKVFDDLDLENGSVKMVAAGAALTLMAIAVNILASAVAKIAVLDWNQLAKGLTGTSVLLAALILFTKFAEAEKGSIKASIGLILLGGAIHILASAVEKFGVMDTGVLQQGLLTLAGVFAALAIMVRVMNNTSGVVQAAVGLLILNAALAALYFTMKLYEGMEWETLEQGLSKIAIALVAVGIALQTMPKGMPATALGLIGVSIALAALTKVLEAFATMTWEEIAKGLVTLAGALLPIAAAMWVMSAPGTLAGAAALVIVVAALGLLLPLLLTMGAMPWEVILLGLAGLAGVFVILGAAGYLLAPVVPVLIGLGIAIGLLGAAMLAAGAGMALFGVGFAALATTGVAGVYVLIAAFEGILALIPLFAQQVALGLIAFAIVIRDAGPQIVGALTTVLNSLITAIRNTLPNFFGLMEEMIIGMVNVVTSLAPQIYAAGLDMIIGFLEAIREKAPEILDIAIDIVVDFINGISDRIQDIIDAGADLLINFLDGISERMEDVQESATRVVTTFLDQIATAVENSMEAVKRTGGRIATAIADGLTGGLAGKVQDVVSAATGLVSRGFNAAKSWLGIRSPSRKYLEIGRWSGEGVALGMDQMGKRVAQSSENVGKGAIFAMKKTIAELPKLMDQDPNLTPTITPVLDLENVRKGFREIDPMLDGRHISVGSNRLRALELAELNRYRNVRDDDIRTTPVERPITVQYTQTNTSPKALSSAEIYRQTNNQLSTMKDVIARVNQG